MMKRIFLKNKIFSLTVTLMLGMLLSACGGQRGPDEFMVLKNPALSVPPDFHMTPDGPNSDLDEVINPQEIAKRALFGAEES